MMLAQIPQYKNAGQLRQWPTLVELTERIAARREFQGALLLGSFAAGRADPLSDIDLLIVVRPGDFEAAWAQRHSLYAQHPLFAWDVVRAGFPEIGAHKWLTAELVLVECLIATPTSGVRLAEPFVLVVGDSALLESLPRRRPITRREVESTGVEGSNEVERRYDELKAAVREQRRTMNAL